MTHCSSSRRSRPGAFVAGSAGDRISPCVPEVRGGAQDVAMRQAAAGTVERVRGMNDVSPAGAAARKRRADEMLAVVARGGYAQMDFPVGESTELFLRKAGEERVQQMYAFRYRNRDLCLRPEFTASVLRSVIPTLPSQSL